MKRILNTILNCIENKYKKKNDLGTSSLPTLEQEITIGKFYK